MVVLGISFDSVRDNAAFAKKYSFPFRLLSDPERSAGVAFGAAEDATARHAKRFTFVIDAEGNVAQSIDTRDPAGQAWTLLGEDPPRPGLLARGLSWLERRLR